MAENEQLSQLKAQVAQYDLYLGSSSNLPQNIRDADRETQRQFIDRIQASRASVLGSISQLEKGQISGTTDQLIGQANEAGRSASYYGSLGRSQSNAESNFSTLLDKYNSGKATTQDIKNLSQSGFLNQEQRSQLQASIQPQQQNIFTSNQNMSYDPYLRDTFGNPIGTRTPPSERAGTTSINFNAVNNRNQSQYISELNMTPYRNGTLTTGLNGNLSIGQVTNKIRKIETIDKILNPFDSSGKTKVEIVPEMKSEQIASYDPYLRDKNNNAIGTRNPPKEAFTLLPTGRNVLVGRETTNIEQGILDLKSSQGYQKVINNPLTKNLVFLGTGLVSSILFKPAETYFNFGREQAGKVGRGGLIAGKIALAESNPYTGIYAGVYFGISQGTQLIKNPINFALDTFGYVTKEPFEFGGGLVGGGVSRGLFDPLTVKEFGTSRNIKSYENTGVSFLEEQNRPQDIVRLKAGMDFYRGIQGYDISNQPFKIKTEFAPFLNPKGEVALLGQIEKVSNKGAKVFGSSSYPEYTQRLAGDIDIGSIPKSQEKTFVPETFNVLKESGVTEIALINNKLQIGKLGMQEGFGYGRPKALEIHPEKSFIDYLKEQIPFTNKEPNTRLVENFPYNEASVSRVGLPLKSEGLSFEIKSIKLQEQFSRKVAGATIGGRPKDVTDVSTMMGNIIGDFEKGNIKARPKTINKLKELKNQFENPQDYVSNIQTSDFKFKDIFADILNIKTKKASESFVNLNEQENGFENVYGKYKSTKSLPNNYFGLVSETTKGYNIFNQNKNGYNILTPDYKSYSPYKSLSDYNLYKSPSNYKNNNYKSSNPSYNPYQGYKQNLPYAGNYPLLNNEIPYNPPPPYNPNPPYNTQTTTSYPTYNPNPPKNPPYFPITKEPPPKTKDFPMFFDLDERKPRRAFRVQVKRRGKFFNVGQPLPLGQAKRLGSSVVETSLARTFRLVPEGLTEQQDNPFFVNQEVFRESRISNREEMFTPLTFIERKGQTLKNVFEVNEIQYERSISDSLFSIPKSKKKKKSILKRIGNNIINFGGI